MLESPFPSGVFPDGKQLLVYGNEKGKRIRLYVVNVSDGQFRSVTPELHELPSITDSVKRLSPDGKFLFVNDLDQKIYVYPTQDGERFAIPGILPEEMSFQWSADGNSVYVCNPTKFPAEVYKVDVKTGQRIFFSRLLLSDYAGVNTIKSLRITSDESSYAYSYVRTISTVYLVDGLK